MVYAAYQTGSKRSWFNSQSVCSFRMTEQFAYWSMPLQKLEGSGRFWRNFICHSQH